MKPEYAVQIIDDGISNDTGFRPFSNGSKAAEWVCENCGACKKAMMCYDPEGYENFRDGGRSETLSGLNSAIVTGKQIGRASCRERVYVLV